MVEGNIILAHKSPKYYQVGNDKGEIISEQKCGVLNFPKMQQNYC
jgi:hypothetical protein